MEKISWREIFARWAFHKNLTCGENMEEYGRDWCICGCHVYHETWEAATVAVKIKLTFPWCATIILRCVRSIKTLEKREKNFRKWNGSEHLHGIINCTGAVTLWWQAYLPISVRTVGLYCPYDPRFPLDAVQMASSTSRFAAAIA